MLEDPKDVVSHDRWFVVEVAEHNGEMEYQDRLVKCVPARASLWRELQEMHLDWRSGIDEDWDKDFDSWAEYYDSQCDEAHDGAIWSDHTLIFFPEILGEISEADSLEWDSMRSHNYDGYRTTSDGAKATAARYIKQAANFLAKEKGIEATEAHEQILYELAAAG